MRVKLLTGLTAAIMALTPINAFAASDFSLGNGQLEYKGTISGGAGKEITLTVLKPGYAWDEATWSNGDSNAIAYWDSTTIDSSGNYSFKLNLSESGVYNVIYTVGGDKVNGADTIENIIKTETEKVTEDVVAMTTTDDIEVKIKESYADMGISADNLDKKAGDISKIILNSKELLDKDDAEKSVAVYKKADAAAELNNGLITDIAGCEGDLGITESDYEKWYNASFSTKVALRLSNKNFDNVKTFDEAVCEAVLLERIANPDGNSDVIGIIKDFYDEIGLASASVSNYAASKIAGNS
ncbi:MAG: hypothetical protein U0M60_20765, partial [Clostridia bacterium]|nr:hypothetical protein [Clostridia bacterium]